MARVTKNVATTIKDKVKIELLSARNGVDYIYHKLGSTKFENGEAEVSSEVASELKDSGLVKLVD